MGRVNCYLPDDLKAEVEALEPMVSFSQILRRGVIAELRERRQSEASVPREPVEVR